MTTKNKQTNDPKVVDGVVWTKQMIFKLGHLRLKKEMSFAEIGEYLGFSESAVKNAYYRAVAKGYMPQLGLTKEIPDSHQLKRVSTNYDSDGKLRQQWVIQVPKMEHIKKFMDAALDVLSSRMPDNVVKPVIPAPQYDPTKVAVYPIGDAHFGLLSWGEETGEDYDLKIAQRLYKEVFSTLINNSPSCGTAVLVNVGDWFHCENTKGITERSGHHLDKDSRYDKMVRIGLQVQVMLIETLRKKHKHVHVINAKGNHDETMATWLNQALALRYKGEKNISVDTKPGAFSFFRFGKNLIGVTHGLIKKERLLGVMAAHKDWSATKYRIWLTGHIHHKTVIEDGGLTIESFNTLTAKDAYTVENGYIAKRNTSCIIFDKERGEVMRLTINL